MTKTSTPEMATVKPGAATITYSVTLSDRDGGSYYGGEVESTLLPDEFIVWAQKEFNRGATWRDAIYVRFESMTSAQHARMAVATERGLSMSMIKRTLKPVAR